jgi:hypothetical protein
MGPSNKFIHQTNYHKLSELGNRFHNSDNLNGSRGFIIVIICSMKTIYFSQVKLEQLKRFSIDVIKTVAYLREYRVAAMRGLYLDTMQSYANHQNPLPSVKIEKEKMSVSWQGKKKKL